jgi:hypothetical protein
MPIINNYNYYDGSSTEKVPPKLSEKWIKDCIDKREIALNLKSAKMLDDNRVIIRASGKAYLIETSSTERIGFNDINQPVFAIERVAGIVEESTFIDHIRSNVGLDPGCLRCSVLNSNKHRHHLNTFWNSNM